MLENHGVLVIGADVAEAWHRLYFLERACQVQILAQSTGQPLIRVSDELAARTAGQFARDTGNAPALFEAVRRAARQGESWLRALTSRRCATGCPRRSG